MPIWFRVGGLPVNWRLRCSSGAVAAPPPASFCIAGVRRVVATSDNYPRSNGPFTPVERKSFHLRSQLNGVGCSWRFGSIVRVGHHGKANCTVGGGNLPTTPTRFPYPLHSDRPQDTYAATMPGKVKAYELQSKCAFPSSGLVGTSSMTDPRRAGVVRFLQDQE